MRNTIIVTGHGTFASGVVSAMQMIMGPQENVVAVDFTSADTAAELRERFREIYERVQAGPLLVLADLRGGSPSNMALEVSRQSRNVQIIYGANLPLLIDLVVNAERENPFHSGTIDEAREAVGLLVPSDLDPSEESEDAAWM